MLQCSSGNQAIDIGERPLRLSGENRPAVGDGLSDGKQPTFE